LFLNGDILFHIKPAKTPDTDPIACPANETLELLNDGIIVTKAIDHKRPKSNFLFVTYSQLVNPNKTPLKPIEQGILGKIL